MAERVGFEPTIPESIHAFQACADNLIIANQRLFYVQILKIVLGRVHRESGFFELSRFFKSLQSLFASNTEGTSLSNFQLLILISKYLEDLFGRNHQYKKVKVDNSYPKFILENLRMFKSYIL